MIKCFEKQKIASYIFSHVSLPLLLKISNVELILPYYHLISDNNVLHVSHLFQYKSIRQFESDIDYILKYFNPISYFDLIDHVNNHLTLPKKSFHLTFDDGYSEVFHIIAPILLKKGVPATFFVSSNFIDNIQLCYLNKISLIIETIKSFSCSSKYYDEIILLFGNYNIISNDIISLVRNIQYNERSILDDVARILCIDFEGYLNQFKPYLTTDQILSLIDDGFTIGSHSQDHPLYSEITISDQIEQTKKSINFLVDKFNLNYKTFAFPHTDSGVTAHFFREIFDTGIVDLSFGTSGIRFDIDPKNLQRISMEKPLLPSSNLVSLQLTRKVYRDIIGQSLIDRSM